MAMVNKIIKVPAPTGGYNNRDNITNMEPNYAVILENMVPKARSLISRKGYVQYASLPVGEDVETIMSFRGQTNNLFAATASSIYDITDPDSVTLSKGSQTSGRWSFVMFDDGAGSVLVSVNGFDKPIVFNGTTWIEPVFETKDDPPVDQTDLSKKLFHVVVYQKRLFFLEKNSLTFWFLDVDDIAGELHSFSLSSVFPRGGHICGAGTWSRDGGSGMQDMLAFFSSNGEVAVYSGTDISTIDGFSLAGLFQIGEIAGFWHDPVAQDSINASRSVLKIGSDLHVITSYGVVPLSRILPVATGASSTLALTDTVIEEFSSSFQKSHEEFGWQIIEFPFEGYVIINIPEVNEGSDAKRFFQLVMNQTNSSWCKFTRINALCFHSYRQRLFFGGTGGIVYEANKGYSDNNEPIQWTLLTSYQDYGIFEKKMCKRIRPYMIVQENSLAKFAAEYDYQTRTHFYTTEMDGNIPPLWDQAIWDVDVWYDENVLYDTSRSLIGRGIAFGIYAQGQTLNAPVNILRFDVAFEVAEHGEMV